MKTQLLEFVSKLNDEQLTASLSVKLGEDDFVGVGALDIKNKTLIMYVFDKYYETSLSYEELYHFITEVNKTPFTKIKVDFEDGYEQQIEVKELKIDETNEFEDILGTEQPPYFETV